MQRRQVFSALWTTLSVNYIYCDVFSLHWAPDLKVILSGEAGGMAITQGFLLGFSAVMEIPMAMIVLALVLPWGSLRVVTVLAALVLAAIQGWSLTLGGATLHYLFFSAVEIGLAAILAWLGWTWREEG